MTNDQTLLFMARRQLLREPLDRAAVLLGPTWPLWQEALQLASAASEVVLVGPVAAALRGYPTLLDHPRVGLIGRWSHQGAVLEELMGAGAMMVGFDTAPRGQASRETWLKASGASVSVGWLLAERAHEVDELLAACDELAIPGGGTVQLPSASALHARAAASRWPADRDLVTGLDAVLLAEQRPTDGARPEQWIAIDHAGVVIDRSLRAEHVALTIPFTGELPATVRRAAATRLKELAVRDGDHRSLRACTLSVTDQHFAVSAAAPREVIEDWVVTGDLVAAVEQSVTDAYRAVNVG